MELGLARLAVCPQLAIIAVGLATAAGCVMRRWPSFRSRDTLSRSRGAVSDSLERETDQLTAEGHVSAATDSQIVVRWIYTPRAGGCAFHASADQ